MSTISTNAREQYNLGLSYRENGQHEEAIEAMKKAVEQEPENAKYQNGLGFSYHANRQYEEAIEAKKKAVKLEPNHAGYQVNLSVSFHANGRYEEAIEAAKKAVELKPDNAEYQYSLGLSFHENRQYEEAIEVKRIAVKLKPGNAGYLFSLGKSYHANGQYEEAIEVKRKAAELEPNNAGYQYSLGLSFHENGQYSEAITAKKRITEIEPKNARYLDSLGASYHTNGQYEQAIEARRKAVQFEPDNAQYHFNLSLSYYANRQHPETIEVLKKAVELEPGNANYQYSLGVEYYATNQYDEAINKIRMAISLQKSNNKYRQGLSIIYRNLKMYTDALKVLDEAIVIDSGQNDNRDALLYYHYAWVQYLETGTADNSIKYFEEGKRAYLTNMDKKKINNFLNVLSKAILNGSSQGSPNLPVLNQELEMLRSFAEIHADVLGDTQYYFLSKIISTFKDYPEIQSNMIGIHLSMKQIMKQCAVSIPEGAELAHYSRLENLNYLVKKSDDPAYLRLNNAAYMNDPSEGLIFISTLKDCHGCDAPLLNKVYERFTNEDTNMQASDVYLFSLTLRVDDLPMWAQYGDKGHGCCLVIKNDFFDRDNDEIQHDIIGNRENGNTYVNSYIPYRVIYVKSVNNTMQLSMTKVDGEDDTDSINQIDMELKNIVGYIHAASERCHGDAGLEEALIEHLRESIDQIRYLFKTTDYEYEKELRLIRYEPVDSKEIQLNKETSPVPTLYVKRSGESLRYTKIILGPKVEEANRIAPYLKYVDPSLKVEKSNVPFR
ncbi:tetratricopeptide repeat protein [Paenibacillus tianjinensis]|uniref:Tetratricopeptide repeat protein n=1 Tax=Paenibacillus tianjinensis TaxID=2810347 RepID=A0ABX7L7P6_9BACL|nr:tetratricopeptide repeat protein [Paenibacillus tianjinensis]QSF44198.1 tetratricopeptide repeat protein [Paenibacillus tianjinensis]